MKKDNSRTFTTCNGIIQSNGFCDTCNQRAYTTSIHCGRLIEVTESTTKQEEWPCPDCGHTYKSKDLLFCNNPYHKILEDQKQEGKLYSYGELEDIVMEFGIHWKTTQLPDGPVRIYFRDWLNKRK